MLDDIGRVDGKIDTRLLDSEEAKDILKKIRHIPNDDEIIKQKIMSGELRLNDAEINFIRSHTQELENILAHSNSFALGNSSKFSRISVGYVNTLDEFEKKLREFTKRK